jgi:hypothetical protein
LRSPPICSGRAAVGAATNPPEGAYVMSFNVIAERFSISRQRPKYVDCDSQVRQNATVSSKSRHASATRTSRTGPADPVSSIRPRICPADRGTSAWTSPSSTRYRANRSSSGSRIRWTVIAASPASKTAPFSVTCVSCCARP